MRHSGVRRGWRQIKRQRLKLIECLRFEALLMRGGRNVAIGQEQGIRGVIVAGVKGAQLRMTEIGNCRRIAAAVVVFGGGREQSAFAVPGRGAVPEN